MSQERIYLVPPSDYSLFQKLQAEAGKSHNLKVYSAEDAEGWYNPDLDSPQMAVRLALRQSILENLNYEPEEYWIEEPDNIANSLEKGSEVRTTLGTPDYLHYAWQNISNKTVGRFEELQQKAGNGPLINVPNGTVLFVDEIKQLAEGEAVTTIHSSGLRLGFLSESKEVYKVIDGDLHRIRGQMSD
jgi:hypothetical protein